MIPFILIFALSAFGSEVKAPVFSQTVGSVDGTVFTSRQAVLATVVGQVMRGKKVEDTAAKAGATEIAALLLDEALAREANSFGIAKADEVEIEKVVQGSQKALQAREPLRKFEFENREIKTMAERRISARNLIDLRSEAMRGVISDTEAQNYFDQNRVKFGTMPFSSFKDNIKNFLATQQQEQRLRSWFDILKRKYKIKEEGRTE